MTIGITIAATIQERMNTPPQFDAAWFRHVLTDLILPRWLEHAATGEGLFLPQLDSRWRPAEQRFGTVVSQTRLIYNFAEGYRLTGDARYLRAVRAGTDFLLQSFRDHTHDGFYHAVGPGGRVLEDGKDSYDHAFAVFALAHACDVTGEASYGQGLHDTWDVICRHFRDEHGGLIRNMSRDFQPRDNRRTQNPVMHLFEALLAAAKVDPAMLAYAAETADFVRGLLKPVGHCACLPEFYTLNWEELPASRKGMVSVGHQFEWAFLLSAAVEQGLPADLLEDAARLLDFGMRYGYDPTEGGTIVSTTSNGSALSSEKGWWEQCELVRALLHHVVRRGREDLWAHATQSIAFVKECFADERHGGWHGRPEPPGGHAQSPKGNAHKVDYHVVAMCVEAIRLGGA